MQNGYDLLAAMRRYIQSVKSSTAEVYPNISSSSHNTGPSQDVLNRGNATGGAQPLSTLKNRSGAGSDPSESLKSVPGISYCYIGVVFSASVSVSWPFMLRHGNSTSFYLKQACIERTNIPANRSSQEYSFASNFLV